MRKKGLSIFQKLFIAFLCIALITLIISGVVHYKSKKIFIERTITSQLSDSLQRSIDYFNKTFIIPITKDLGFIEASPTLNNFLTSQKDETLLTKPPVERLFLYFTRRAESIYLSSRFIDSKGEEKIIAAGKRRVRDYVTIDHFPNNVLYRRIHSLFKRLKSENLGSILFEGPFNYKNKLTFVIGMSKIEPEIGGFGGAVIFHCDLTGYLNYLSDIKFNQTPIAFVFSPDNHVMLSPEKEASPDPGLYLSQEENTNNALAVSSSVKLGSNNNVLLNLALRIPRTIFFSELKKALIDSALIGMAIILLVGFVAFFLSMRLFAKPIKKLSHGTERIGSGDLDYRIKIETHDEIAQLADEFNRMTESLQKTTVSRDMLIQEVNERKRTEEALKESEEKYRTQFEEALDAIFIADAENGIIVDCNHAASKLVGRAKSELIGKHQRILHPPKEVEGEFSRTYEQHLKEKEGQALEAQIITKNGEIREVSIKANIFELKGKKVLQGIFRDITEQNRSEAEKKKLEAQLQQAYKMESIGTLAGGIAHDFNNILSPIMIHSEMAMMDLPSDNPIQFNLKQILKASERARDMVKQILAFGRQKEPEKTAIKMGSVFKEIIKLLRSSIPTIIDIRHNIETEDDTLFADPTQIHQVILNLCTNASHAMREKGGMLKIELDDLNLDSEAVSQFTGLNPGSYLRLTVSDTGQGIDPEVMNRIFEPYFTTKGPGEGTGMGLAAAHGIVRSHGGDIICESEPGKGTTFRVLFPKYEEEITEDSEGIVQLHRGTERILFVDDEKAAVDVIQSMLTNLGYKVTARTSSIEALEAFRNNPQGFDLVITDMTMPNMTGKDLAKELMSIRPDISIVLCTGFSDQIDEHKAKAMGISAFVMKPIVMRQIANTIREVLDEK